MAGATDLSGTEVQKEVNREKKGAQAVIKS